MTSRKKPSIYNPAGMQKRFGLLLLLAAIALLTLNGSQAAAREGETSYSVLYNFTGGADGGSPDAGVIRDEAGNLYGTTYGGGSAGAGVVFRLDRKGNETVLYSFTGGTDGGSPVAGLIRDEDGNLYGTTSSGGNLSSPLCHGIGCGVVFRLDSSGNETVLHSFSGGADGDYPTAGLIRDAWGNFYGTTESGGNGSSSCPFGSGGCGVVFKLDPWGKETVLYTFSGGADGAIPDASLIRDKAGNLYGTAQLGGNSSSPLCITFGCGVVFKLDRWGKETVLYAFTGGADGSGPYASLVRDAAGNLNGTTGYAGNLSSPLCAPFGGCGVVFKVDPTGKETVLYTFTGAADGSTPFGGLTAGGNGVGDPVGNLYGTTSSGGNLTSPSCAGSGGCGVVFKVNPSGKQTVLHAFSGTDGSFPFLENLLKHQGSLYGTAVGGGTYGAGVIFKVTLGDERDDQREHDQGDH